MTEKLSTEEQNGEKVFTVELDPGSEIIMTTADTYVDKNIKVKAKATGGSTKYTSGTGIDVDNDNYVISVDDTVVTTTKLSSGEIQAIDLDPNSSHVISQVITATESYLGPTYLLYTVDTETGQLDPTNHGGLFYETEGLDNSVVAVMNQDEDGQVVLGSYADRPRYYNADTQEFSEIAFTTDLSSKQDNLTPGSGISIQDNTVSVDDTIVAQKSDLETLQPKLTAGANIVINEDNVISAVSGEEGMPPFPAKDPTKQYMLGLVDDPDTGLYKLAWVFIVNVDEESY